MLAEEDDFIDDEDIDDCEEEPAKTSIRNLVQGIRGGPMRIPLRAESEGSDTGEGGDGDPITNEETAKTQINKRKRALFVVGEWKANKQQRRVMQSWIDRHA